MRTGTYFGIIIYRNSGYNGWWSTIIYWSVVLSYFHGRTTVRLTSRNLFYLTICSVWKTIYLPIDGSKCPSPLSRRLYHSNCVLIPMCNCICDLTSIHLYVLIQSTWNYGKPMMTFILDLEPYKPYKHEKNRKHFCMYYFYKTVPQNQNKN